MCRCLTRLCTQLGRALAVLLSVLGLATLLYALFLLSQQSWHLSPFPITLTGWGALLFLSTLLYASCGYESSCCTTTYALLMFLFFLANAAGAAYYFTHEDQCVQYLNQTLVDVPDGLLSPQHIQQTLTLTLYSMAGLSGVVLLSAVLALCQRCALVSDTPYDYNDTNDDTNSYHSLNSDLPRSTVRPRKNRSDLDRAVEKSQATVAANRFREKYSDMYDKYGIQSDR
jgi:hypothetical protein